MARPVLPALTNSPTVPPATRVSVSAVAMGSSLMVNASPVPMVNTHVIVTVCRAPLYVQYVKMQLTVPPAHPTSTYRQTTV